MTDMDEQEFEALQNRLMAYSETERYADGERLTRQALTQHPQDPDLLGWLAGLVGSQNRTDEAMEIIDEALRLRPDDDRLLWIKSGLLHLGGDRTSALDASTAALNIDPHDVDNLFKHAGLLAIDGRNDEAIGLMRRALELDPDNPDLHLSLGACHTQVMNWAEAEEAFEASLRIRPDSGEAWKMIGAVRTARNKVTASLEAYTNAVRCDPSLNVTYYLAWPILHTYYRSRWLQPLAVILLVCAPASPMWNAILRGAAALVVGAAILDAVTWPFRGGRVSWRAMRMLTPGHLVVSASCAVVLCGVFTMLGFAIATGSVVLAWWTLLPITALWILNLLDSSFGPDEEEDVSMPLRMLGNIEYTIGYDLKGLWKRLRGLMSRDTPGSASPGHP